MCVLLCTEPGLDLHAFCDYLYVVDQCSWHYITRFLSILDEEELKYSFGFLEGVPLQINIEGRFSWTLRRFQPSELDGMQVLRWCQIPQKGRPLLAAYAAFKSLHIVDSISAEIFSSGSTTSSMFMELKLVMMNAQNLEHLTSYLGLACIKQESPSVVGRTSLEGDSVAVDVRSIATTIVDVTEIDVKCFKTEPIMDVVDQEEETPLRSKVVSQGPRELLVGNSKKVVRSKKELGFKSLFAIARNYEYLYPSRPIHDPATPFPINNFEGQCTLIECPVCNLSSGCKTSAAFRKFLSHVLRRHSDHMESVLPFILEQYSPDIAYMQRKIGEKKRKAYIRKLKKRVIPERMVC